MSTQEPVAVDETPHEEAEDPYWLRLIPKASPWESRTVRN